MNNIKKVIKSRKKDVLFLEKRLIKIIGKKNKVKGRWWKK